jgi:drug/metabolite transporter (DMT)-like permease
MTLFERPPRPGTPLLWGALLCLIWGTTYAVIRVGLQETPPFLGVAARFTVASLVLLGLVRWLRLPFPWSRQAVWLYASHGVLTFCIAYGVTYWAELRIPSGLAALVYTTYPLWVAILAHYALPGERFSGRSVLGLALGLAGLLLIYLQDFEALGGRDALVGTGVMLLSPVASAIGSVVIKRYGAAVHPMPLNAVAMGLCAVVMGGLSIGFEAPARAHWSLVAVGAVLYLALLGSVVTFSVYFWLLRHVRATRLSLIAYVIPVVAVLLGALLLAEPVTLLAVLGGALVLVGVRVATV